MRSTKFSRGLIKSALNLRRGGFLILPISLRQRNRIVYRKLEEEEGRFERCPLHPETRALLDTRLISITRQRSSERNAAGFDFHGFKVWTAQRNTTTHRRRNGRPRGKGTNRQGTNPLLISNVPSEPGKRKVRW